MTKKGQGGPLRMLWCVVWLALVLGLEHHGGLFAFGRKLGVSGPEPLEESSTALAALQYGLLSNAGYRPVQARRVRLISLSSGVVCPQREFMADLIRALNAFRVSFIAIDKYFGKGACPEGDPGTAALLDAVAQSPVPIVVGRQTDRDQAGELSRSAPELFDVPSLRKQVKFGLIRFNSDTRKIPLEWPVEDRRNSLRSSARTRAYRWWDVEPVGSMSEPNRRIRSAGPNRSHR